MAQIEFVLAAIAVCSFYPAIFKKMCQGHMYWYHLCPSLCLLIMLFPPKLLYCIRPNLLSDLLTEVGHVRADLFRHHPGQGCGNTLPDLPYLLPFHSGQVENFYLLVLGQEQIYVYKVNTILYFIF